MNWKFCFIPSVLACIAFSNIASANELASFMKRKPQVIEDVRPGTVSERNFSRISRAQQLMAESKFDEALSLLEGLIETTRRNAFALAQVYQTMGYVYAQTERYGEAADSFGKCLELKALPIQTTLSTMYSRAQVLAAQEKFFESLPLLQDYVANKDPANPDAVFFYGQVLAQVDARKLSIEQVEKAIALSAEPKETWYRLLAALFFEEKDYPNAKKAVSALLAVNPERKQYWQQLSSVQIALEEDDEALASLELAYKKGFLSEERDILQLVRLSLFRGIPYKAAVYLQEGLEKERVEANEDNLVLLADAWTRAQQLDEALGALSKAAPLAKTGKIFVRQGQIYLEREKWNESAKAFKSGLAKGGLDKPGFAYVALGIAQYRLEDYMGAMESFRKASQFEDQKRQASEWLTHLNNTVPSSH